MKRFAICLIAVSAIALMVTSAFAAGQGPAEKAGQAVVDTVANGCKMEIESFCNGVTPGEGRILACLYARQDQLSGMCEYALYDAAVQLERAVSLMTFVASECADDLEKHCESVEAGEGRLLKCLEDNQKDVSNRCKTALQATGMKSK
jgi:hypothetical protein